MIDIFHSENLDRSKPIDMRERFWGHSFGEFTPVKYKNPFLRLYDKFKNIRRYRTHMFYSYGILKGQKFIYRSERGIIIATIYKVDRCRDPYDMHFIELYVKGSGLLEEGL
jgi:hypothetical protein